MKVELELQELLGSKESRAGPGWRGSMVSTGRELRTECQDLRVLQDTRGLTVRTDLPGTKVN